MKKILFIYLCLLTLLNAQLSNLDIKNIGNEQLDLIREELKNQETIPANVEAEPLETIIVETPEIDRDRSEFFGYDYFKNDITFIDNIPPPKNFILGPGDEIIISMWGDVSSRESFILNNEGNIFYETIGFINLSGKTISQAEDHLVSKFSKIISTLSGKNSSTELDIELTNIQSMNIYFSGEVVNPGLHLVHPFADIFVALTDAGGVLDSGSLRNIEVVRNGNIIENIDFYSFFIDGKSNFSKLKLIDGDIIHIPVVKNRVEVQGNVTKPKFYEILPGETLENIIYFSGGLLPQASSLIVVDRIIPISERISNDNANISFNINYNDITTFELINGDIIDVREIGDSSTTVTILGKVKSPGIYAANNTTLKQLLDLAGGFNDPFFRKTLKEEVVVLRLDETQFYAQEFNILYDNSSNFFLQPDDKIIVYENINYNQSFTIKVEGEVKYPGTYPLKKGLTLSEAIEIAGGLTELGSLRSITVLQEFSEVDDDGFETIFTKPVANVDADFELGLNSVISALPYENVISIEGNVYNPGLITYTRGMTMSKAIELAGGYKPYSMKKRAYVKRANGEIEQANFFRGRAKRIFPGDSIFVPLNPAPTDFDITTFIADFSSTLANIAAILIIVDNN